MDPAGQQTRLDEHDVGPVLVHQLRKLRAAGGPFMGGQKITGNLGEAYREYLVGQLANGRRGSADLCSYFFLRASRLLREAGQFGFLATNTIAQVRGSRWRRRGGG